MKQRPIGVMRFFFSLVFMCLLLFQVGTNSKAESICPFTAKMSLNGRYVIGVYGYTKAFIWDLTRLDDPLQPVQVHRLKFGSSFMPHKDLAISPNGSRLAYKDTDREQIIVCEMRPGFTCSPVLKLDEDSYAYIVDWSFDADSLIVQTKKPAVLQILEFGTDGEVVNRSSVKWARNTPIVDWKNGRIAVGSTRSIKIYDLSTLELKAIVPTLHSAKPIAFSEDGNNLITREGKELYVHYLDPRQISGLVQTYEPILDLDLLQGSNGALWYIQSLDGGYGRNWKMTRASKSGKPSGKQHLINTGGPFGKVLGLSHGDRYAVVATYDGCSHDVKIINLKNGLTDYSLYPARGEYITPYFQLPHLPTHAGVDLAYRKNTLLNASLEQLLHYGELAIMLRDRYDSLWFAIMATLDRLSTLTPLSDYYTDLASIIIKVRTAEKQLKTDQPDKALQTANLLLIKLDSLFAEANMPIYSNKLRLRLQEVVIGYIPILRTEILLIQAHAAISLGQRNIAKKSINYILDKNPLDWRANAGRIFLNLEASAETFVSLLSETQEILRLSGWTDEFIVGYPPYFFDEATIRKLRATVKKISE